MRDQNQASSYFRGVAREGDVKGAYTQELGGLFLFPGWWWTFEALFIFSTLWYGLNLLASGFLTSYCEVITYPWEVVDSRVESGPPPPLTQSSLEIPLH